MRSLGGARPIERLQKNSKSLIVARKFHIANEFQLWQRGKNDDPIGKPDENFGSGQAN
jgi:hypothetical protein